MSVEKRIKQITAALITDESREKVSEQLGYSNPKSMDQFMRRHQYYWYPSRNNYFPNKSAAKSVSSAVSESTQERISVVIRHFEEGEDAREVARKLNFQGQRELARFMRSKGLEWSQEQGNYVYQERARTIQKLPLSPAHPHKIEQRAVKPPSADIERYMPLLRTIEANWGKLMELLNR